MWAAGGRRRRLVFPVTGGLLVAAVVVVAWFAMLFLSWTNSVCNDEATVVTAKRQALRLDLLFVWLVVAAVPVIWGFLARTRHRRVWPWATLAAMFMFVALGAALTSQPGTWCAF